MKKTNHQCFYNIKPLFIRKNIKKLKATEKNILKKGLLIKIFKEKSAVDFLKRKKFKKKRKIFFAKRKLLR